MRIIEDDPRSYQLLTREESEILGALSGDGCMSKTHGSVQITIAGHKLDDREYLMGHIRPMFAARFDKVLKDRVLQHENTMHLYGYSKQIAAILSSWGMPFGKKKQSTLTPSVLLDETSFVRGLFDTDGSVYCKYGPYMQIQFKSASLSLMSRTSQYLANLGFHPTSIKSDETKFRFCLSRQAEVVRFFCVIEPKNPKHLLRFHSLWQGRALRPYSHRSEIYTIDLQPHRTTS